MTALVDALRDGLAELADPVRAPQMQRYMRSTLPFRGVPAASRRRLLRALVRRYPAPDPDSILELWHDASFREERYLAVDLTGVLPEQTPRLLDLHEELIVTGAWWDYVDPLAIHRVGPLLRGYPDQLRPVLLRWSSDADRWKRRTAVICQVGSKGATDVDLLARCVVANLEDRDFFLRKGIGWALRQHARTDPDWVRRFVADHHGLAPLARREALRHVERGRLGPD